MKHILFLLCVLHLSAVQTFAAAAGTEAPLPRVPEGFVVERVAGPPLVNYPTLACFDDRGRLFVSDSAGLNLKKDEAEKQLARSILMLEDTDGDGRFDRSTVFADKMTFPMGGVWHDGALYVASSPNIWRLEDTDGDGKADRKDIVVGEFEWIGAGNDMKGPFLGPDGRFYFPGGMYGIDLKSKDGLTRFKSGRASCVFSCRKDGNDLRFHSFGPLGLYNMTFSPEGELLGAVVILRYPRGDGLLHWVYGGQYPNPHFGPPPWSRSTGDVMPVMHEWGQTAPCGILRYRGIQFGAAYQANLFTAQFNTHKVIRSQLTRDGATFRAVDEDFLVSSSPDFHPSDVLQDADGSLLVIDTGGWYVYECPMSKISKPIRGAIYRVRRVGSHDLKDPRGLRIDWPRQTPDQSVRLLDDARHEVRDHAIDALARQQDKSVPALGLILKSSGSEEARRNAVWALCRIATPAARAALGLALADASASVRQSAVHSMGVLRDRDAAPDLIHIVASDEPPVRREAATALGLIRSPDAVAALLAVLRTGGDQVLRHAMTYALIEIGDAQATRAGLADTSPHVRRAALIALDQMPGVELRSDEVTPLLDTDDYDLQRAAFDVINRHKTWSGKVVGLLEKWLAEASISVEREAALRGSLLAFAGDEKVQAVMANALARNDAPHTRRLLLLEVIARCELSQLPGVWRTPLATALTDRDERVVRQAIDAIETVGGAAFNEDLLRVAGSTSRAVDVRTAAAAVALRGGQSMDETTFRLLVDQTRGAATPVQRLIAARALGDSRLSDDQLAELTVFIAAAGPLELPVLVRAFAAGKSHEIGLKLIKALEIAPGLESLSARELDTIWQTYPPSVHAAAAGLVRNLNVDAEAQAAKLAELSDVLHGGDAARGRNVFFAQHVSCVACHSIGGQGGRIGPDLTRIAEIRRPRDLLESIVFPNATLAQGYQGVSVTTKSGSVYTGIIERQSASTIYLRSADSALVRIEQSEIEELSQVTKSIMPQGFDKLLTIEELRDLLAYLSTLKSEPQISTLKSAPR